MQDPPEKKDPEKDKPVDRARRRLLKQGMYLAPTIISLTAFVGTSEAQARIPQVARVNVVTKAKVFASVG